MECGAGQQLSSRRIIRAYHKRGMVRISESAMMQAFFDFSVITKTRRMWPNNARDFGKGNQIFVVPGAKDIRDDS